MFRLCADNIPKILDLVNKTQFRNLRMFRTLSDNLAHKLVYSDVIFVEVRRGCRLPGAGPPGSSYAEYMCDNNLCNHASSVLVSTKTLFTIIPKILDLVNKTQFRNLRMFRTLSDNLAHKLVYSDFLDFVVIITECLFDRNKLMLGIVGKVWI
jgi:hypothetical protein